MKSRPPRDPRLLRALPVLAAVVTLSLLTPTNAHAYIDPLSGSILLQVLAAGLLAGLFTIKRVWLRVTGVFRWLWSRISHR